MLLPDYGEESWRVSSTPVDADKITLLRVAVGFAAVSLFGRGTWATSLRCADRGGDCARRVDRPSGAKETDGRRRLAPQLDVLGDRMIENVYFTYLPLWNGSLCCRFVFCAWARRRTFCAALHMKQTFRLGREQHAANVWGRALVASRWSRGSYAR